MQEEQKADNFELELDFVDESEPDQTVSPAVEEPKNEVSEKDKATKAYSERLKKDREKIKEELESEIRNNIAKEKGFESWKDFKEAELDDQFLGKGLDPEVVRPMVKDIIKNDPEYIEAMKYKKEKEELEAKIWASNELKKLNDKFSLKIKDISELDEETIKSWNNGLSLDKAYAANHYDELQDLAIKKLKSTIGSGKDHLKDINSGNSAQVKVPSDAEKQAFKKLIPGITDDQILDYINKQHK